jgi:hypothetical protein
MKTRHTLAGVMGTTTALAIIPAAQAYAHDSGATTATVARPIAAHAWFSHGLSAVPLEKLDAWATRLQKTSGAVPDGTVLKGRARLLAKRELAAALGAKARLHALTGLTAAQQAKVDVITARLAAAAASLRALLANAPTARVTVVPTTKIVRATDLTARHHCDGFHDGGFRYGSFRDRSWSGFHR